MAEKKKLTYTFVNPNTPKQFENQLKKIILEKLVNKYGRKPL